MNISGDLPVKYMEILTKNLEDNNIYIQNFKVDTKTGEVRLDIEDQDLRRYQSSLDTEVQQQKIVNDIIREASEEAGLTEKVVMGAFDKMQKMDKLAWNITYFVGGFSVVALTTIGVLMSELGLGNTAVVGVLVALTGIVIGLFKKG